MRTPAHGAGLPKEHEKLQRYYDTLLWPEHADSPVADPVAAAAAAAAAAPAADAADDGAATASADGAAAAATIPATPSEREAFWAALRRELPNSFRFCGSRGHALAVRRKLDAHFVPQINAMEPVDGVKWDPPTPVPWYPDGLAYSMTTPRHVIRKFAPFAAFQRFLVSENSVGNISRQEVVSMIPPLLMDLEPGMTVLDMCAAPGSKAAQLLEMLHAGEEERIRRYGEGQKDADGSEASQSDDKTGGDDDDGRATGLLVANDADYKRSHMLVHQLKRLSSPNLLVTNHDATMYPPIRLPASKDDSGNVQYLRFDRILADVPCSGDGTLRKNANLWRDWVPGSALGLHVTQVRILVRALQLLKVGGRVVYSTCSMNPVENESVVVSAIERCGGLGNVAVVDCGDRLAGLKRAPGLRDWKIMDKSGRIWGSWEEVRQQVVEHDAEMPGRIAYSMFARPEGAPCADVPLERCMRVYPHMQDTGGFFITVLEKRADFKARPEDDLKREIPMRSERRRRPEAAAAAMASQEAAAAAAAAGGAEGAMGGLTVEDGEIKNETLMDDPPAVVGTKRPLEEEGGEGSEGQGSKRTRVEGEAGAEEAMEGVETAVVGEEEIADVKNVTEDVADVEAEKVPVAEAEEEPAAEAHQEADADAAADTAYVDADAPSFAPPPPANGALKPSGKVNNYQAQYEEPYKYLSPTHPVIDNIVSFYNVAPRFPRDRFMVRNATAEPAKSIYYTSARVRDILVENEGRGLKFVHGGIKMFVRQDAPSAEICRWRIQSEGMGMLEGYVGPERVVTLTRQGTLRTLLQEMFPRIADGEWRRLGEIGERVRDVGMGCCVLRVEPRGGSAEGGETGGGAPNAGDADDGDAGFDERMVMPLWKSLASLNLMLPKEDRAAMLLRFWNDNTPLVNNTLKDSAKARAEEEGQAAQEESAIAVEDAPTP
jgi:multisite-specific tRNA:(cytosine-C5)-methyltransferase